MNDVLLFSGGIDSLSSWFYMGKPKCIYVDMMTKYSLKEIDCIKKLEKLIPNLKVKIIKQINLGQFEDGVNAFIPMRNLILASIASNYGNRIIMAGIKDDNVEDKNPKAFKKMSEVMSLVGKEKKIKVYSPFWHKSKTDIVEWMLKNVDNAEEILRTSVSCYSNDFEQCGNCPSCLRKAIAFEKFNLSLDFFKNDVRKCSLIGIYIKKFKSPKIYTKERIDNSMEAFKKWGWKV